MNVYVDYVWNHFRNLWFCTFGFKQTSWKCLPTKLNVQPLNCLHTNLHLSWYRHNILQLPKVDSTKIVDWSRTLGYNEGANWTRENSLHSEKSLCHVFLFSVLFFKTLFRESRSFFRCQQYKIQYFTRATNCFLTITANNHELRKINIR